MVWALFALRFSLAGAWPAALVDGVLALVNLALWAWVGPLGRAQRGLHIALGINLAGLVLITPLTGGVESTAPLFLVAPPLFAALYLGVRSGAAWALASVAAVVAAYLLPVPDLPVFRPEHPWLDVVALTLLVAAVAVTQRRTQDQHVEALEQARREAQVAAELKQRLLATVSHELRTPLAGSLGLSRLLREELDGGQREQLDTVIRCGEQLSGLLDDLLDQAALGQGAGLSLVPAVVHPQRVAHDVLRLLSPGPGVELVMDCQTPRVVADPRRLRQVLINLIGNSIKFTQQGRITVRMRHQGSTLEVLVIDTGIGIADPDRVLQAFEQDDPEVARRYGGTGLGLSICRGLCEQMGGGLELQSTLGQGTRARAWLRAPEVSARGKEVLVVEDNPVNAEVLRAMLNHMGHSHRFVETAEEALREDLIEVDLVLMDLRLPGMSGFEAFQAMRARVPDLRVVAVTANVEERERCLGAGMDGFLAKPFRLAQLEAVFSA